MPELVRSREPLQPNLLELVREIRRIVLADSEATIQLADASLAHGVVPEGKPEDAQHVAYAFVGDVDVLT